MSGQASLGSHPQMQAHGSHGTEGQGKGGTQQSPGASDLSTVSPQGQEGVHLLPTPGLEALFTPFWNFSCLHPSSGDCRRSP